jgi:hypothetical protein
MSATVRTVFCMSSSAAHRLECYGQVEVNPFEAALHWLHVFWREIHLGNPPRHVTHSATGAALQQV